MKIALCSKLIHPVEFAKKKERMSNISCPLTLLYYYCVLPGNEIRHFVRDYPPFVAIGLFFFE